MASIDVGSTPASLSLASICLRENPQSINTHVSSDLSKVEFPALPEPRWVISIPIRVRRQRTSLNQSMRTVQRCQFSTYDGVAVGPRAHERVRTALHHHDKSSNDAQYSSQVKPCDASRQPCSSLYLSLVV